MRHHDEEPESWAHEIKWDGYRVQVHLDRGSATIYTRRGHDWTTRFPTIAAAVPRLPAKTAILDGEAVVLAESGAADFHELRRQLGQPASRIVYRAFDLLWLDGQDMRSRPWGAIGYVEPLYGDGAAILRQACALGLEGILSKRVDAPYRGGRSDTWCRTKCERSDTFAVVGFGVDEHKRLKSLHLARASGGELAYVGAVEQGHLANDREGGRIGFRNGSTRR